MSSDTKILRHKDAKRELPDGWRWVRLGDLGPLIDGDWILNADYTESGVRLIQVGDVGCGQFVGKSSRFISANRAAALRCTLLQPGDILISRMPDPIGRACILPDLGYPCITAVDVSIWRSRSESTLADVLVAYLNTEEWYRRVLSQASGATRARISRTKLQELELPLPPLTEQRRIAGVLKEQMAAADKARAAAQARLEAIKSLPAAFLRQVFPRPGQPLPDGWRWVRLGEVCRRIRNGTTATQSQEITGIPVTRIETISTGDIDATRVGRIVEPIDGLSEYMLEVGDILFSHINSVERLGNCAIYSGRPEKLIHGMNLLRMEPNKDSVFPDYLLCCLRSDSAMCFYKDNARRAIGQASLNTKDISALPLSLPPLPEQRRIAAILKEQMSVAEKARAAGEEGLETINALPAALLRRAFSGEI